MMLLGVSETRLWKHSRFQFLGGYLRFECFVVGR